MHQSCAAKHDGNVGPDPNDQKLIFFSVADPTCWYVTSPFGTRLFNVLISASAEFTEPRKLPPKEPPQHYLIYARTVLHARCSVSNSGVYAH